MLALLTSCGRPDLLETTISSLYKNQGKEILTIIHEDSIDDTPPIKKDNNLIFIGTGRIGQHKSIEKFLTTVGNKYYLHIEDDWEFKNEYDWIGESIRVMKEDSSIIKVLCRDGSPHPCNHNPEKGYGYLDPWESPDGIIWHGFSWNPGVTRLDLLKQFIPFPKWEQDLAEQIYKAGYKVAELIKPVYKHIGDGRSTH